MKANVLLLTIFAAGAGVMAAPDGAPASAPVRQKPERLTANGTLLWRGKPFFPIGIYHVNHTEEEYALLAAHGFNTVQGHFATEVTPFLKTLDLAARHNLAVDVPLHADNLVKENLEKSLAKIRAAAGHPAVLSWKILDEPDSDRRAGVRDEVPPAYRAIKALNPGQPVELTLCKDATLGVWTRLCDVVQIDRYPVPGRPLTEVADFCERVRREMEPWQNLTVIVQCGWTADLKTQPTFAQARAMVYLALISGAKGIFWYSRKDPGWDLTTTPLWPRLKEINAEIAALSAPVLLGLDVPGIQCSAPGVRFAARQHLGKLFLLATNPADAPADAVFTLPSGLRARAAQLAGSGQRLALTGASVHVPLAGTDSATIVFDL